MIKGLILRNFMAYRNAFIPFEKGLNIICGPNGAGKSTILLAIGLALGQSTIERSRRIKDLIRHGEEEAAITLILDNSKREKGKRPFPRFHTDTVTITRVLKASGKYKFYLQKRPVTKEEILKLVKSVGIDPDNMLLIMHQYMVEKFGALSPQEKLRLVEEVTGLSSYRRDVLEARRKLSIVQEDEKKVGEELKSAKKELDYWRRQCELYMKKKELEERLENLIREKAWLAVKKQENKVERLKKKIGELSSKLEKMKEEVEGKSRRLKDLETDVREVKRGIEEAVEKLIELERRAEGHRISEKWIQRALTDYTQFKQIVPVHDCPRQMTLPEFMEYLSKEEEKMRKELEEIKEESKRLKEEIKKTRRELQSFKQKEERLSKEYVDSSVDLGVKRFLCEQLEKEIRKLRKKLGDELEKLRELEEQAKKLGPRIETERTDREIDEDIGFVKGRLKEYEGVTEEVFRVYESYKQVYEQIEEKARKVAERRKLVEEEVKKRMEKWKELVKRLLDEVNGRYRALLAEADGRGEAILVGEDDIESAGLDIVVGYKGGLPSSIDSYVHSGGERSFAIIAFLLALQGSVKSPIMATDEYDVRMDPRNREVLIKLMKRVVEESPIEQYIVVTPGSVPSGIDAHIITVQRVGGESRVGIGA